MNSLRNNLGSRNSVLLALMILLSGGFLACTTDEETEPTETNDVVDDTDDDTDGDQDTDDTSDSVSDIDEETDAVTYPFDVATIRGGCEAFDGCELIDQFGGSVDGCLDYANSLLVDAADCVDELEGSFGCAADASSCAFETECADETQALTSCREAVSYPFDVPTITGGCEAFDACGLIDQFGGSVDGCLDYANSLLIDAADCVDELEGSFGCADEAGSCNFETECSTESQALSSCRNSEELE